VRGVRGTNLLTRSLRTRWAVMKFVHDGCEQTWLNIDLLIPSPLGYAGQARRTLGPRFHLCSDFAEADGPQALVRLSRNVL
jgi:hypothetical protein